MTDLQYAAVALYDLWKDFSRVDERLKLTRGTTEEWSGEEWFQTAKDTIQHPAEGGANYSKEMWAAWMRVVNVTK